MNKILLILQREYLTRVRKRAFLLLTFISPIFFAAIFIVPAWLAHTTAEDKYVLLLDETGKLQSRLEDDKAKKLKIVPSPTQKLSEARELLAQKQYYALVHVPKLDWDKPQNLTLYSPKGVSSDIEAAIQQRLKHAIERYKLELAGLTEETLKKTKASVQINSFTNEGKRSSSLGLTAFGFVGAFLIYFATFYYGSQVMHGVVEEKTSRVVEVIISTVKPFQLMLGKILGVALMGLTQLALWGILTFGILFYAASFVPKSPASPAQTVQTEGKREEAKKIENASKNSLDTALSQINLPAYFGVLGVYFIFGYLLYASLFAAFASAVDNESEMQQFVFPLMLPLFLAMGLLESVLRDPDGAVAFWASMFPFTSPVIMLIRYPFGVPAWQLATSMIILVLTFLLMVNLAGRVYRVGILMYGKRVNYLEMFKWIFYK